jgi:hypothetical protein
MIATYELDDRSYPVVVCDACIYPEPKYARPYAGVGG